LTEFGFSARLPTLFGPSAAQATPPSATKSAVADRTFATDACRFTQVISDPLLLGPVADDRNFNPLARTRFGY
jgi:hypothetical protein